MVANDPASYDAATSNPQAPPTVDKPSPRLELPADMLAGLSVATLAASNDDVEFALVSGEAQDQYERIVDICCGDLLAERQRQALTACFLGKVRLDLFARYWSPETASAAGVVAQFTFLTALFGADDVRDSSDADAAHVNLLAEAWRAIPELVDELWAGSDFQHPISGEEDCFDPVLELFDRTVEWLKDFGSRDMDAHARLLAMACAQVRVAAGSDAAYAWFARECATWGAHSFAIQQLNMARVPMSQLLHHRYREGATTLTIVHMFVASGLPISSELVELLTDREQQQDMEGDTSLLVSAGLHICLVNDILSYDRDKDEAGFLQNFVEYQRQHGETGGSFDAAVDITVDHCNTLVRAMKKDMEKLVGQQGLKGIAVETEDRESDEAAKVLRIVLRTVARSVLGNIRWSAECARYSRVELIMDLVSAP